ncbi:MAG: efflux RND transporter periplasmic adaptor subunit [Bacteroidota bacterium]
MKNRRLWFIGGSVLLIVAAFIAWRLTGGAEKVEYRLEKVDRGDVAVTISATGTLSAVTTVQVGSQVSGTIAKLYADYNSVVKEGQLLAQLDPTFLQASVNEQRANVDRARAQVSEADRTMKRTAELYSKSLVSQADMDAATTALESAKATLLQSQAALDRAVVNLKYATIRAPISGVVISRNVDVGQTVAASLSAPTLFTIANDLRRMQVQASVDEADIGNVKIGQGVTFRVDSYPDREFHGRVSQVRLAPVVTQNVVTYSVIIDVNNPDMTLMPGMTATVTIEVDSHEGVLRVPIQATRFTPPNAPRETFAGPAREGAPDASARPDSSVQRGRQRGGGMRPGRREGAGGTDGQLNPARRKELMQNWMNRGQVWVLDNGVPKAVPIVRGLQNTRYVEVLATDLKEGDQVIIAMIGGQAASGPQQTNPFQPQRFGGPGRRGGM